MIFFLHFNVQVRKLQLPEQWVLIAYNFLCHLFRRGEYRIFPSPKAYIRRKARSSSMFYLLYIEQWVLIVYKIFYLPSNNYASPNFALICNPYFLRRANDPRGFRARKIKCNNNKSIKKSQVSSLFKIFYVTLPIYKGRVSNFANIRRKSRNISYVSRPIYRMNVLNDDMHFA